jgi:hypothetical protein
MSGLQGLCRTTHKAKAGQRWLLHQFRQHRQRGGWQQIKL